MIQSIWSNDFYEKPPQPLWAFEVSFLDYKDITEERDKDILRKAVTSCKIPERKVTVIPTYFGGTTFNYLGRSENSDQLTLNFNENEELDVTAILQNLWSKTAMNQNWPEKSAGNTDGASMQYRSGNMKGNEAQNIIRLKILKPNDNFEYGLDAEDNFVSKVITFYNCQLMQISDAEFDYGSEDVMKISATFQFDYYKITQPLQTITVTNDLAGTTA